MPPDRDQITPVRLPDALGGQNLAAEALRHGKGNAATSGIWRVRGPSGSAILKVARRPEAGDGRRSFPTSDEPTHYNYWRRESLAYESGFAATVYAGAGIVVSAMLAADAGPDGGVELWLAAVTGTGGFDWPPPRLARFARELGAAQASYAGRVPDIPWLSRRWLAQYLAEVPNWVGHVDDAAWDHPYLACWPEQVRVELRQLWSGRARLLAASEAAERTLCHLDVWPANLIDDEGASVLFDWSFTGEGALGEDAANLIVDCFADGLMDIALLPEVAETVPDAYLAGLRDAGWAGSDDHVRRAIATCGAAKYSWFGPALAARAARDDLGASSYRQDTSVASAIRRLTPLVTLIAAWAASIP
jgi:hypothetical protein